MLLGVTERLAMSYVYSK